MITLKIKPYNKLESCVLHNALVQELEELQKQYCIKACVACPVRHLCIDLQSATLYAEDCVIEKRKEL